MMHFTYVVRPGEAPEGRGPQFEPFWNFLMNFNLRLGFLLQLAAYAGLLSCASLSGKSPLSLLAFLHAEPAYVVNAPEWAVLLCCGLWIFGHLLNMAFLQISDDDSSIKQSRGFRAGTKFMMQATSLGAISWVFSLISFYASTYYFDDPWMEEKIGGGSQWLIFFSARTCDILSLILYAGSVFFLETFHSEGVGEAWGWLTACAFKLTALSQLVGLTMFGCDGFCVTDAVYTVLLGISLCLATLWALLFEPVSHRYDVKLTQSAMRNEYYKSRNAMAYYGPATVNADGEIDIAAAAEQAQACLNCSQC